MQNRETSEEFAREQENANKGWEICYGASAKAYLEWMDQMLEQGTAEAHEKHFLRMKIRRRHMETEAMQ